MAAAVVSTTNFGSSGGALGSCAAIPVTVAGSATVYASASGGLPVDLAGILAIAAPGGDMGFVKPEDIVGIIPGFSTGGFVALGITLGTATYTDKALVSTQGGNSKVLATCPAWIRLVGVGAAATNHAALGEVADGAVTDTVSFLLIVGRSGPNR